MPPFDPGTLPFRFDALPFRDQLVLWSARMWITASVERPVMPARVEQAFEVAGVPEAAPSLHQLLTIISTAAHRTVEFHPVPCPMLADEEARFLLLITAARNSSCHAYAFRLLLRWVPPAAARLALAPASTLAVATFGRLASPRERAAPGEAQQDRRLFVPADPGISRVH